MSDIGILDATGKNNNPLTGEPFSQTYKDLAKVWAKFPAYAKAKDVIQTITDFQLTFIVSGTGSGKTVLIPKFALHYTGYLGKVAVTLPKRQSTSSAAIFAAKTLDVTLGKEIGYVHKGSPRNYLNEENKMIYMTDGTLIMKMVKDPLLSEYKVVIIDEAHERKVQIDLLLLFLKKILSSGKRPDLKVIIMSATIDTDKYQKYFSGVTSKAIHISGQPNHPIKVEFLDKPVVSYLSEGAKIIDNLILKGVKQDILFFITTSNEALQLCQNIRPKYPKIFCIELYSEMDKNLKIYVESRDEYLKLGNYDQRLVMATNVAESSITIDGLKYVIDSCFELSTYFDPDYAGTVFEKKLITKAQALQRRGRVGRTEPGTCFHLLTEQQFNQLDPYPQPNILTQDITLDILKIMQMTDEKTYPEALNLINQLMDLPKKSTLDMAYDLFKMYNILDENDKITKLGSDVLSFSSLSLNQSLFLIYSFQLYCAREACIIVTMIETTKGKLSSLFFKQGTMKDSDVKKGNSRQLIRKWSKKKGDHFSLLAAYLDYDQQSDPVLWCRENGLKLDVFGKIKKDHKQLYGTLVRSNNAPQIAGSNKKDLNKRILEALKLSHKHKYARGGVPVFSLKKQNGQVQKDSSVYQHFNKKELANKNYLYDDIIYNNGTWEYNAVTIV